jgi:hypothetical protein
MKTRLIDVAEVIRSKNSGPYEITFDIIFKDWKMFDTVCAKKIINESLIAKLYGISEDKVINIIEFKPAKAIKATIVRPLPSGGLGETDVYGAQQHAPLLGIEFES